jgi:hypothetical protein
MDCLHHYREVAPGLLTYLRVGHSELSTSLQSSGPWNPRRSHKDLIRPTPAGPQVAIAAPEDQYGTNIFLS